MSRQATCDRCGRSALIQRGDSLPIGWMYFHRDKRGPERIGNQDWSDCYVDNGYDLCDVCYVNIQQEITFAKMDRS